MQRYRLQVSTKCNWDVRGILLDNTYKFVKYHNCQLELFSHYPRQVSTKVITSIITLKLQDNGRIIRPRDVVGEIQTNHCI